MILFIRDTNTSLNTPLELSVPSVGKVDYYFLDFYHEFHHKRLQATKTTGYPATNRNYHIADIRTYRPPNFFR